MITNELKQTLVVTRYGEIDQEWLHWLEKDDRHQELIKAGKAALGLAGRAGKLLLHVPDLLDQHVNG